MTGSYGSLAAAGAIAKPADAKIQVLRSNCDDNKLALERAALLMVEAMSAEMKARPRSSILARRCHFLHTHMNKPAVLVVTLLLLLTFFERPYWCRANPVGCLQSTPQHGFITSGTPYINTAVANLLEALAIGFLLIHLALCAVAYPLKRVQFFLHVACLAAYIVDLSLCALPTVNHRAAPYLRACLLVYYSPPLQLCMILSVLSEVHKLPLCCAICAVLLLARRITIVQVLTVHLQSTTVHQYCVTLLQRNICSRYMHAMLLSRCTKCTCFNTTAAAGTSWQDLARVYECASSSGALCSVLCM
eukprot:13351-Heterococcus_DN1.PRE.1